MKIKVTMKDPDTMQDAVREAVALAVDAMKLSPDEKEVLTDARTAKEQSKMAKWFEHGEYLAVEFDTETMTATVLEAQHLN